MKYELYPELCQVFQKARIRLPDLYFTALVLDKTTPESQEFSLTEFTQNGRQRSGCYAWIEDDFIGDFPPVMYVGKAVQLRSRLVHHWNHNSPFLRDWYRDSLEDNVGWSPFVCVWFTEERAALEAELLRRLNPQYNYRLE